MKLVQNRWRRLEDRVGRARRLWLIMLGVIGLVLLLKLDKHSAEVTSRIAAERDREVVAEEPRDRPYTLRPRRPSDCDTLGKQFVAWRADGDPFWQYDCVDANLGKDHVHESR